MDDTVKLLMHCIRFEIKGEPIPTPGLPESLNVLLHELQGLALSIKME